MDDNYAETTYNPNARLVILKALAEQNDYRLNDTILLAELNRFGFNKGKGFIRTQLTWLAEEAGALKLTKAGTAIIAELTETGVDHVERRQIIPGVARPSAVTG